MYLERRSESQLDINEEVTGAMIGILFTSTLVRVCVCVCINRYLVYLLYSAISFACKLEEEKKTEILFTLKIVNVNLFCVHKS